MIEKVYDIRKRDPVARFFYRGESHSHPVRRTVLVISTTRDLITGYEIRSGAEVREQDDAPVKSYRRDRIPAYGDYWRLRRYNEDAATTTLRRCSMANLRRKGA